MRYPGGKGKCFQQLINLIPPHETYIETHVGGGAVLRNKLPADNNIAIDINSSVIDQWLARNIQNIEFVNTDATRFLASYEFSGNEFIYSDPPYLPETRRRARVYKYDYSEADHHQLLKIALKIPCMMMISGYESELYNDILCDWRKITFQAKTHQGVRKECVWLNYEETDALHDARYLGNTYRERQTIKKRQERLRHRIHKMPPVERQALIKWLNESYGKGATSCR